VQAVRVVCDRCGETVEALVAYEDGRIIATAGVYISGGQWDRFMRPGEGAVCDRCMQTDPAYMRAYPGTYWRREGHAP